MKNFTPALIAKHKPNKTAQKTKATTKENNLKLFRFHVRILTSYREQRVCDELKSTSCLVSRKSVTFSLSKNLFCLIGASRAFSRLGRVCKTLFKTPLRCMSAAKQWLYLAAPVRWIFVAITADCLLLTCCMLMPNRDNTAWETSANSSSVCKPLPFL